MLEVYIGKKKEITKVYRENNCLYMVSEAYLYRFEPKREDIVRVTVTGRDTFLDTVSPGVICRDVIGDWDFSEDSQRIVFCMKDMHISVDKTTASFTYLNGEGQVLLKERANDSKSLEEFTSYKLLEGEEIEKEIIQTADGKKEVIKAANRVEDEKLYHTRMWFDFAKGEHLYGLGQHEEGVSNLRGQTIYVHQENRKIAIPFMVSDKGYGLLVDTYSPMIFNDTDFASYLYTEADRELDYYFINGITPDGAVKAYRFLTGKAVMLPKWAFGYVQSQERYETQEEILQVAKEYRERGIGLDGIVLDWMSWEDGKWGQKSFDYSRFPNPTKMTDDLHEMGVHFMISIWPNMDGSCENYKEFKEQNLLLPGSNVYNAFEKAGRDLYWKQVKEALFSHGIDAWWCDSSEPYTPSWNHVDRMEPAKLYEEYCREVGDHIPASMLNAFALYHAMSMYEGQRDAMNRGNGQIEDATASENTFPEKRVCNLTRSAYTGQQRYGTILWSGDTAATWDTLKRQVNAGLMFSASGLPYWTADIGAFFVKHGCEWFWKGDYPEGLKDLRYQELYVRWFQWCCFLPMFRAHGTDVRREMWQFEGAYFEALKKANRLRYRLMPYIYTCAGRVWLEDASFIRPLGFAFPQDEEAKNCQEQYMFGDSLMVCPITDPCMAKDPATGKKRKRIYLPKGQGWYNFETKTYLEGGQWIERDFYLDQIPVFVKAGSVLPLYEDDDEKAYESTVYQGDICLEVYVGIDGKSYLYEDAGDGYAYEEGDYTLREFFWEESQREVEIRLLHGSEDSPYAARIKERKYYCPE